jgi:archaellum component FlaC
MPPEITSALLDFGALGIASGAIFWLYVRGAKRQEELITNFQAQLKEQADECNKREADVRDRYDAVVRKYDEERIQTLQQLSSKLDSLEKDVKDMEAMVKEGLGEMRQHYAGLSAVLGKQV